MSFLHEIWCSQFEGNIILLHLTINLLRVLPETWVCAVGCTVGVAAVDGDVGGC